jgi:hypothetical protein
MKKLALVVVPAIVALGLSAGSASAGSDNSHASACGAVHGAFADQNGNFGFLGEEGGAPGHHDGQVGQQHTEGGDGATGYNNSHTNCQG